MNVNDLSTKHCQPRKGEEHALGAGEVAELLKRLPGWQLREDGKVIGKDFKFEDFRHTLGFINAVGFMANHEDHHPDLEAGYGHCQLRWSTHDVGGLSLNDFICAARVEAMLAH
ncbi:MAG: 4a-hydroxytetrahydrobiopterin dehydratase [Rhodanobacter sp.]